MEPLEQWIWLPKAAYPHRQTTGYTISEDKSYTVCAFDRTYALNKPIVGLSLRVSGDTAFRLFIGDVCRVDGPASAGGDFLFQEQCRPNHYAYSLSLTTDNMPSLADLFTTGTLPFHAEVRMKSERMFEYSKGHGGFMLTCHVTFADQTRCVLLTDQSWNARLLPAYQEAGEYDNSLPEEPACPAEIIPNLWHCETAPIPPQAIRPVFPLPPFTVAAGEHRELDIPLGRIWGGYIHVDCRTTGETTVRVATYETENEILHETCRFIKDGHYEGFGLCSASRLHVTVDNHSREDATVCVGYIIVHYPVNTFAKTLTSDHELNLVTDVCAHTLKICRQTLHLDSTLHCEPMACTGDYYIESLMTAFTYGDMRLAAFDVRRTAELLRYHDGRMFHTAYSLIWVQMLYDTYRLTGETALLSDCEEALELLLARFESYVGSTGLIENPPDYMFIDWLYPDGINLHHPPKALGQSCLNLYYYGALKTAALIFNRIGLSAMADRQISACNALKKAILENLWDAGRSLFFEGLNTPSPEESLNHWLPQNIQKRYYRRHANILACYFGILPPKESQILLRKIFKEESLGEVQPYFMHFWLEAVYRCGLREEETLPLLALWKEPCKSCSFGLTEGFYKPVPTYGFDHSHAWGGTPAYALPLALSGFEMVEPGFKKIRMNPSLLGLDSAHVEIPTPYGMITLDMKKGNPQRVSVPEEITVL